MEEYRKYNGNYWKGKERTEIGGKNRKGVNNLINKLHWTYFNLLD